MKKLLFLCFVFTFACSTTGNKKRFVTMSTSRNVKYDEIKQKDSNQDIPLWANDIKAYEKIKNKDKKSEDRKYYSALSTVATMGSIETCYKMASLNIKSNISSLIEEAFTGEIATTREGDSEKHMTGYVKDTMASVTKNVFSSLEREDVFYKEVFDKLEERTFYQCFALYSIKKTDINNLKLSRLNRNTLPKDAKETLEKALETTRDLLENR